MTLQIAFKYIIWVFVGGLLLSKLSTRTHIEVLGNKRERWRVMPAILLLVPLILWCSTRSIYMGDTGAYYDRFFAAPTSLSGIPAYSKTLTKDKTFYIVSAIIRCLITNDHRVYFGIIATVQLLCLGMVYRKYSRSFWLSIFLFVASTDYIAWMFNGTRQFLAATISFTALPFIVKKRYIPSILLVLLASLSHRSALLLLPVIFVVQGDAWNKKTLLIMIGTIFTVVFIGEFTTFLDDMLQDTQYKNVVSDWTKYDDDGTNRLRVLVYAVPTILALLFRGKIAEARNPLINVCVNMSIMSTAVYVISMFTSGIFIGRLPIYMSLYNYILLPWEVRHCFKSHMRLVVTLCMCGAYLLFYAYTYM